MQTAIQSARDNPNPRKRELPSTAMQTAPRPLQSISGECVHCKGSGIRSLTDDECRDIPGWQPGYSFSVPCEYCVQARKDHKREELQSVSMMTNTEKLLRLNDIVTKARADTPKMVDACRSMVRQDASMLTIWGTNGNAKSAALIATVNEFLDRGIPAIYLPSYDLLNWLQDTFRPNGEIKSESMYERLERIKSVRMLAVDEFQAVKITDWRLEQLRNLIDRRWRDGLDGRSFTMLAMNEDPASLESRIWSRLRDGRNCLSGEPIILNEDADMRPLLRRKA